MQNHQTKSEEPESLPEYNFNRKDSENRLNENRNLYGPDSSLGPNDAYLPEESHGQLIHNDGEVIIIL